ncbi:MAG TPA: TetR/AcrR family transcriptional regulator [Desulfosalsimonadaceae bacterium]|nr:TetR/AcrR family transcriptional regulator [Desulfosalsimonadaceae bacterium]
MNESSRHTADARQPKPSGRTKLADALRQLLAKKDFSSITTAEISRTSGVNESLIYRYFGDKRGLLHAVLDEYLENFVEQVDWGLRGIEGAKNKLRKYIWSTIYFYDQDRVFSKILLLEVRNYPGYFTSETYGIVKQYTNLILQLIEDGINGGEIRKDLNPRNIRQIVLGGIEHLVLPAVINDGPLDPDLLTDQFCLLVFDGIVAKNKK